MLSLTPNGEAGTRHTVAPPKENVTTDVARRRRASLPGHGNRSNPERRALKKRVMPRRHGNPEEGVGAIF